MATRWRMIKTPQPSKFTGANLGKRVISSVILGPAVIGIVYQGGLLFNLLILAVMLIALTEWVRMTLKPQQKMLEKAGWIALAIPYIGGSGMALVSLRSINGDDGMYFTFYLLGTVWATDIGAFLAGRLIGGPKLCPKISPKKTWAGLIGGMASAGLIGYGVARGFDLTQPMMMAGLALGLAVIAQIGDFFESWVKRRSGVKDSGNLIPGHGGILDRIDGLMFAAIFLLSYLIIALQW